MLTPALDKVQRWAPAYADNGVRTYGFMVHSDVDHWMDETHVRAAYALDIAAAVAEARRDEREKVAKVLEAARGVDYEAVLKGLPVDEELDRAFDRLADALRDYDYDAAQPAPGKEGTP
jgi:hypothetical protein